MLLCIFVFCLFVAFCLILGVSVEGIFRISSSSLSIKDLYLKIISGQRNAIQQCKDIHVCAGTLKKLLRETVNNKYTHTHRQNTKILK